MAKVKVLLVDDEKEFITTLAERLALRGIVAQTEFEGVGALRRMESDPPGVVVLDMMMPGLGGLEVLKAIRERSPRMPVILLTGQGISSEQGVEGLRLGAFALLMKPPDLGELLEWIGKAAEADS